MRSFSIFAFAMENGDDISKPFVRVIVLFKITIVDNSLHSLYATTAAQQHPLKTEPEFWNI